MEREEIGRGGRGPGKADRDAGPCPAETPAQVAYGAQVVDCVLLDASRGGARVRLLMPAEIPETATLRFGDGESRTVQRRWRRGAEVGFKVVGAS